MHTNLVDPQKSATNQFQASHCNSICQKKYAWAVVDPFSAKRKVRALGELHYPLFSLAGILCFGKATIGHHGIAIKLYCEQLRQRQNAIIQPLPTMIKIKPWCTIATTEKCTAYTS
ncbi:MAG: hypothetical protein ACI8PP_002592 [Candidatus Pseudothioglobus sp.]|jgi:hypothetical protein